MPQSYCRQGYWAMAGCAARSESTAAVSAPRSAMAITTASSASAPMLATDDPTTSSRCSGTRWTGRPVT